MSTNPQQENSAFQVPDDDAFGPGTLSDFIAKRLQNQQGDDNQTNTTEQAQQQGYSSWFLPGANSASSLFQQNRGLTIHHLDSQLVKDHLEKYLPTPSTRFHMMKERVERELAEISEELRQYQKMGGPEYEGKIQALEQRANLLRRNLFQLDQQISRLNPFLNFYKQFQKLTPGPMLGNQNNSTWKWFPNPNNEIHTLNHELQSLQSLLENHLDDPSFSPQQLGRLVNEYDKNLRKIEKLAQELENRQTFRDRLNNQIQSLYRSWIYGEKSRVSLDQERKGR